MNDPDKALERARAAAASMRGAGAYGEDSSGALIDPQRVTSTKLFEWAVIEPDLHEVRSTRRFGAPVTVFKRGLLRLLAQYHAEMLAQQTRFNVNLVSYLRGLEERVEELERRLEKRR